MNYSFLSLSVLRSESATPAEVNQPLINQFESNEGSALTRGIKGKTDIYASEIGHRMPRTGIIAREGCALSERYSPMG
jgi:hypothetical protein